MPRASEKAVPEKLGRQTPTAAVVLPYTTTHGQEAIDLYNTTGRTAQQWQQLLLYDILARKRGRPVGTYQIRLQRPPPQRQE